MILSRADNIMFGSDELAKVMCEGVEIWNRSRLMPHMDGITNFYDCKKGLTTSSWANQVSNANHAVLTGATITQDGDLQVLCTDASHGYFTAGISHGGSYSMCLYAVFKGARGGAIRQNRRVVGSCFDVISRYTLGGWLSAAIDGYDKPDTICADLWGVDCGSSVYCDDYHVMAVNKFHWQSTYNNYKVSMYIDGVLISEYSDFHVASGVNFGIGCMRDPGDAFFYSDRDLPVQIKMLAVGGESHSAEQIAENSAWLRSYYGLDD
jgi:hypothetical protein